MKTLTVLLVLAAIAPKFGHLHFSLDLFSHFKVHYLLVFILFSVVFILTKSYVWAAVSLAGAMLNLVDIAPWYLRDSTMDVNGKPDSIKVLLSNVSMHNGNAARLLKLIDDEQPDIVGLVEVSQRWIHDLAPLRERYSYHFESPSESYRGLALYSRLPLAQSALIDFGQDSVYSMVADVNGPGGSFRIVLTHPPPPMTSEWARQRNDQLDGIATYIRNAESPVVLVGDLNITMWDRTYRALIRNSRLVNARFGNGVAATWPAIWPRMPFTGIPIDHILVTEPGQASQFRVHDSIGSDHFPVSAIVSVRPRQ